MEHGMWEIIDVLRRHHRGDSNVKIAKATNRGRNTVKRYLKTAKSLGWLQTMVLPVGWTEFLNFRVEFSPVVFYF